MNERIKPGEDMVSAALHPKEMITQIMKNALETRPEKKVFYLPYKKMPGIGFCAPLSYQTVDLLEYFPDAEEGSTAAVDFHITTVQDYDIFLNVSGNVKVIFEGKTVFTHFEGLAEPETAETDGFYHIPISVKAQAKNLVRVICVNHNKVFGFRFLISVRRYPSMWAKDYLFAARATSPLSELAGEDGVGITACIASGKNGYEALKTASFSKSYLYPQLQDEESFDFDRLCMDGDVCYVYTEAAEAHMFCRPEGVSKIWVNGVLADADPWLEIGDTVLLKCPRQKGKKWNVKLYTDKLRLSFLQSSRGRGDKAIFVGPFYGAGIHGPEFDWDFSRVFMNSLGEKIYWQFCDGSQLRIYLDSVFYGQWFYALMVGFYGIRRAAQWLEDTERQKLFCRNMSFLAQYFDYIRFDTERNTMPAFMPRTAAMNVLDNIGTMGMNLIDSYMDSCDTRLLPLIGEIAEHMERDIPRLEDGTYYRIDTMWADDLYMSCPFLMRMGRLTGDSIWFEKALAQIMGFQKKLYIEEEHLFSHIYFSKQKTANKVPWGRGNGWVMWTLSELLLLAEGRIDLSAAKKLFQEMAEGILKLQDSSGLWRQVLNRSEEASYLETSCTAMFLLAFTRGVKSGLLAKEQFLPAMDRAWKGLLSHSIDRKGNVYGVCMGSGCAMEAEYYFDIPTIINDDHGTGIVLAAGSEYYAFLEQQA